MNIIRSFFNKCTPLGYRHSSVDLSAPSILLPWVRVPITPSTLLSIYILIVSYEKDENKQKEAVIGQLFITNLNLKNDNL